MKRARSYEKYDKKGNHFGGLKSPKTPISVGEEYILTIEEMGKEGSGIAKLRGVSIFVNNTTPGDKVMIRITRVGRSYAAAEVFTQNVTGITTVAVVSANRISGKEGRMMEPIPSNPESAYDDRKYNILK